MDKTYKVIVIGDPSVDKGELIAKLETNQLDESIPTIGTSIFKISIELREYNVTVNLMLWDIAGQPQFYMLHRPYFNGADGMVLVFDLTRSSSFSNINSWYSIAVKYGLSGIPRILIGNKAHLKEEKKIILPMAVHLGEKLNAHYYETSSITGENIKEAFEKIAELIYRAKELDEREKDEKLIIKPYQGESIEASDKNHRSPFTSLPYEPYSAYGPFGSSAGSGLLGPPYIESSMRPGRVELTENLTCPKCGSAKIRIRKYSRSGFHYLFNSYTCFECQYSDGEF